MNIGTDLRCLFTCDACGIKDAVCYVPARKDLQEVSDWMNRVCIPTICQAHAVLSPGCSPKTLTNLKIPIDDNSQGIGFSTGPANTGEPTK